MDVAGAVGHRGPDTPHHRVCWPPTQKLLFHLPLRMDEHHSDAPDL